MEKQVSIVVAGSDVIKDMIISPGSTVQQVLDNADLQGYKLSKKGGEPLSSEADLFQESTNFEKFYASPEDVSVGDGGFAPIPVFNFTSKNNNDSKIYKNPFNITSDDNIRIVGIRYLNEPTKTSMPNLYKKKTKLLKTGRACPYWKENGWQKSDRIYRGYYKTRYGKWEGAVRENFFNNHSYFIFYLPEKIKDGNHGACFSYKGDGLYSIHFS
ncbi:hypothetical protein KAR91_30940, partial [Candidatus Pacearchaeota archaeon]|nr:hypothetical protein [Candidatus Pacearchaeota archaeon]